MAIHRFRHSLLWTFTGAFLVVLIAGIALQIAIVAGVVRPAALHWRSATRDAIARTVASSIADALVNEDEQIAPILQAAAGKDKTHLVVYRDNDGEMIASHDAPGMRRLRMFMRHPPGTAPHGPGPGRDRPPPIFGHAPVMLDGETRGYIYVFPTRPERPFELEGVSHPWLLFLPLAAIIAAAAGFILFRLLARRLATLESNVRRIAEGDLDVRVKGAGNDEIGRLGEAFNVMSESLKESRDRLIDADQQRRRFLADVTHDLSTPLTTIRGYAETLLDPKVPKTQEETARYLQFIQEEAVRMDALVADLLDLARVESGSVVLDREKLDLKGLMRGEVERMRPHFEEGKVGLRGPGETGPEIETSVDRHRIEQLVVNLLRNALQHTPPGGNTSVAVERVGSDSVRIVVEDDGPGFRAEDLPNIFERFYRGDRSRPSGGTGLGLAIVRGIARVHGGDAIAENREEGGARITVTLPVEQD